MATLRITDNGLESIHDSDNPNDLRIATREAYKKGPHTWQTKPRNPSWCNFTQPSLERLCRSWRSQSGIMLSDHTYTFWDSVTPLPLMTEQQKRTELNAIYRQL